MPPLVSEELDDFDEDSGQPSRNSLQPEEDIERNDSKSSGRTPSDPKRPRSGEPHVEITQNKKAIENDTEAVEDNDLIAQLQRSAEEGDGEADEEEEEEDAEAETETGAAEPEESSAEEDAEAEPEVSGDVSMQDADQEAEIDVVHDENQGEDDEADEEEEEDDEDVDQTSKADPDQELEDEAGSAEGDSSSEESEGAKDGNRDTNSNADSDELKVASQDCCFCKQSEDNDPSEDFEQYLGCTACSNRAHHQCAREPDSLKEGQDATTWVCPDCATKVDSESPKSVLNRARTSNSAPRLVRDLLPVSRGVQKPNSHSIFAQPLISDGEDGARSLRKRKSPTQEPVPMGKRPKPTPRTAASATEADAERAVAHSTRRAKCNSEDCTCCSNSPASTFSQTAASQIHLGVQAGARKD